jgi:L-2,4-diaminobutyrate decarboxylase
VTPFIGTKGWGSLKLWMAMQVHGRTGLARLAENRVDTAARFADLVEAHPRLRLLHRPNLLAVAFVYLPVGTDTAEPDVEAINEANRWVHARMLTEGRWHLHQFSIPDDTGVLRRGATLYPLRFMAANPRIEEHHMIGVLDYVLSLAARYEDGHR